jgi:hypothetical protein
LFYKEINVSFNDIARRIEKNDRIVKRVEHQRNRDSQHGHPTADQNETPLLTSHGDRLEYTFKWIEALGELRSIWRIGEAETRQIRRYRSVIRFGFLEKTFRPPKWAIRYHMIMICAFCAVVVTELGDHSSRDDGNRPLAALCG